MIIFTQIFQGQTTSNVDYCVGYNDNKLMINLASGGPVHAKYRRMITVYLDNHRVEGWWYQAGGIYRRVIVCIMGLKPSP